MRAGIAFIAHPRALNSSYFNEVVETLKSRGELVDICVTERASHARELAAQVARTRRCVVAVGGDGTAHDVVNGLFAACGNNDKPVFSIIPCGTGNDFCRARPCEKNAQRFCEMLLSDPPASIDVGRIDNQCGQSYFLTSASLGFSAAVTARAQRLPRFIKGSLIYIASMVIELFRWRNIEVELECDGERHVLKNVFNLCISNTQYYGGGMIAAPRADASDGLFDVTVFRFSKWALLLYFPQTFLGRFERIPQTLQLRGQKFVVRSNVALAIQADGERVGSSDAVLEVCAGELHMTPAPQL